MICIIILQSATKIRVCGKHSENLPRPYTLVDAVCLLGQHMLLKHVDLPA